MKAAAALAGLAKWMDEQLGSETASRQQIAEVALERIRSIMREIPQAEASGTTAAHPDGSVTVAPGDVPTALAAVADAVIYCTDDEDCPECAAAADGLCESHSARLERVPGYRALASALGGVS